MILRNTVLVCAAWLVCRLPASAGMDKRPFPYFRELSPGQGPAGELGRFDLDETMLSALDDGMGNLRVVDDNDREVPYLVRVRMSDKPITRESDIATETVSLSPLGSNRIEIIVRRAPTEKVNRAPSVVDLGSTLSNYEKLVTVSGSDDKQTWETLASGQPIFDYSRFMAVRNTRIEIKPVARAFYRIEVSNIAESKESPFVQITRRKEGGEPRWEDESLSFQRQDFRIEKIRILERVTETVRQSPVTGPYSALNVSVAEDPRHQETIVTFETRRVPVGAIVIRTDDANFNRPIIVEAFGAAGGDAAAMASGEKRPLRTATLTRIRVGSFSRDDTTVELDPPARCLRYRLAIRNFDSPPLRIAGVDLRGPVYEAVFLTSARGPLRVFYGGRGIDAPRYDIAEAVQHAYATGTPPYALGAQQENLRFKPSAGLRMDGRKIMVAAVVLMVAALAWAIRMTAKSVKT
jgi:hypothetical protein